MRDPGNEVGTDLYQPSNLGLTKSMNCFLMVFIASGIGCGSVRTTATEPLKMAAIP